MFEFEFENFKIGREILRELIMDEILLYNDKNAQEYYLKLKEQFPKGALEEFYSANRPGNFPRTTASTVDTDMAD